MADAVERCARWAHCTGSGSRWARSSRPRWRGARRKRVAALVLVAYNASADLPERAAVRPRQQQEVRGRATWRPSSRTNSSRIIWPQANRGRRRAASNGHGHGAGARARTCSWRRARRCACGRTCARALAGLDMPVLLACGSEDRLCPPEWHHRWAAMIGPQRPDQSRCPARGTCCRSNSPQLLADALLRWLAKEAQCQTAS